MNNVDLTPMRADAGVQSQRVTAQCPTLGDRQIGDSPIPKRQPGNEGEVSK